MKYPGVEYKCPTCRAYPEVTYKPQVSPLPQMKETPKGKMTEIKGIQALRVFMDARTGSLRAVLKRFPAEFFEYDNPDSVEIELPEKLALTKFITFARTSGQAELEISEMGKVRCMIVNRKRIICEPEQGEQVGEYPEVTYKPQASLLKANPDAETKREVEVPDWFVDWYKATQTGERRRHTAQSVEAARRAATDAQFRSKLYEGSAGDVSIASTATELVNVYDYLKKHPGAEPEFDKLLAAKYPHISYKPQASEVSEQPHNPLPGDPEFGELLNKATKYDLQELARAVEDKTGFSRIRLADYYHTKAAMVTNFLRWVSKAKPEDLEFAKDILRRKFKEEIEKKLEASKRAKLVARMYPEWKQVLEQSGGYKPEKFLEAVRVEKTPAEFTPGAGGDYSWTSAYLWDGKTLTRMTGYCYDSMLCEGINPYSRTVYVPKGKRVWITNYDGMWGGFWAFVLVFVNPEEYELLEPGLRKELTE